MSVVIDTILLLALVFMFIYIGFGYRTVNLRSIMDTNALSVPMSNNNQHEGITQIDLKSGAISILPKRKGASQMCKMYMKVFKNSYEHHAQIYTDARYASIDSVISLRNCQIEANEAEKTVTITSKTFLKKVLLKFEAENVADVREWLKSLTPSDTLGINSEFSPQQSPVLPAKTLKATLNNGKQVQ